MFFVLIPCTVVGTRVSEVVIKIKLSSSILYFTLVVRHLEKASTLPVKRLG